MCMESHGLLHAFPSGPLPSRSLCCHYSDFSKSPSDRVSAALEALSLSPHQSVKSKSELPRVPSKAPGDQLPQASPTPSKPKCSLIKRHVIFQGSHPIYYLRTLHVPGKAFPPCHVINSYSIFKTPLFRHFLLREEFPVLSVTTPPQRT